MILSKNEVKFATVWWPTRMLVQTGRNSFEYKLVKFGERVVVCPRKSMGTSASLEIRSEQYFIETWVDRVRAAFDADPDLSVVSDNQIAEFIDQSVASKTYRTNTIPEDYVKTSFSALLNL